jgi:hypothetical protein
MAQQSYHSQQLPHTSNSDLIPSRPLLPVSGLSRVIAILLSVILLLVVIWALHKMFAPLRDEPMCSWFSKSFLGCPNIPDPQPPPSQALAECDRQLASKPFSIPRRTVHERYFTDTLPKPQTYIMVTLRRRLQSSESDASVLNSVAIDVHRPNDDDPQNNLAVDCSLFAYPEGTASADSNGVSEVRSRMYCDLTRHQFDRQEQVTGILKYRVLIRNESNEAVDYCMVSSCDAQYPAGEACNTGYGNPYGTGSYPSASAASGGGGIGQ